MKITDVKCILLSAPYATAGDDERELHLKTGLRSASLIKVETDADLYGLGEVYSGVYAPEAVAALTAQLADAVVGCDPSEILPLWDRMRLASYYWGRMGLSQSVIGGIEMALWDLRGKQLGLPVHELLGGKAHEAIAAYASGGNNKPADELRAEMQGYVKAGFSAVKIRINNLPNIEAIVQKVALCREALGSEIGLAVDAAQGLAKNPWTVKQAIETAIAIDPYHILWLEEPAEVTHYAGFAEIRRNVSMPVAGGETVTSIVEAESYLQADSLDIFQPDASIMGGIHLLRRVAEMCQRRQIPIAVHAWSSGVGIMGNYHAAFASPNCIILELPTVLNPLREELILEPLSLVDGKVRAPSKPGLGVSLPEDLEEKFAYRPGSYYQILGAYNERG
ncbi:mandelate racemase/muconate lactonizing enzyme family protein [Adhaeretor mobilis]|uniref:D-galactonate dehydratase n=1 Tax=Adhaeretor mobilis TaxID=1930276 RepID=A0A517MVB9_9BACT|nr:mandelate racemase/muconate lactonizing enzyme family protein [Adhaeretor mobilis]QDS98825.1 D-galactonate dehydratase [Adhaeretor mobilis]